MSSARHCQEPWAPMHHPRTGDELPRARIGAVYLFGALAVIVEERTFRVRLQIVPSTWRRA